VADDAPPEETHPWDPSVAATQVRVSPDESIEVSREVLFASITPEAEGRYQLLTELGRGGIGRVVVGFDLHLGRTVACKELMLAYSATGLSGSERDPSVLRFLREARVTGQLEHPSIVPIYELGHRADGTLYYTMKRVRGSTLGHRLSMAETLADRLSFLPSLLDVANAIAYAHSRGVIHRDIKPDNVMLGEFGETVVLDWGLTKVRGEDDLIGPTIRAFMKSSPSSVDGLSDSSTQDGEIMGTPAYMSPEQAGGDIERVDERSDVWSLGAVLFELLTGRAPFKNETAERTIAEVAEGVVPGVLELEPRAPKELATIANKALSRRPVDRYPDARAFVKDLQAFLSGARVSAHRYSAWELVKKFFREHRAVALGILGVLAVSVVGGLTTYAAYRGAVRERAKARAAERRAVENRNEADAHLAMGYLQRAKALLGPSRLGEAGVFASAAVERHPDPAAEGVAVPLRSTLFEIESRRGLSLERHLTMPPGCAVDVRKERAVVATDDGLRVVRLDTGEVGPVVATEGCADEVWMAPSADWAFVRGADKRLRRFDLASLRLSSPIESLGLVPSVAIAPDGERFWVAHARNGVSLRSVEDGSDLRRFGIEDPRRIRFSPDGSTLAVGTRWGRLELRDGGSGRLLRRFEDLASTIWAIAFSRDGRRVAFGGYEGVAAVRDVEDVQAPLRMEVGAAIRSMVFEGEELVVSTTEEASIWSARDGTLLERFRIDPRGVARVARRAPRRFVSVGDGPGLELWRLDPRPPTLRLPDAPLLRHASDRSGRWLFTLDEKARLKAWRDGRPVWTEVEPTAWQLVVLEDPLRVVTLASNGRVVSRSVTGSARVIEPASGKRPISQTDIDAWGDRLAWTAKGGRVIVRDEDGSRQILGGLKGLVTSVALAPTGDGLVGGDEHGQLVAWELGSGRPAWRAAGDGLSSALAIEGGQVLAAWASGRVALFDLADGALVREFPHADYVNTVDMSADWVLTGGDDGKARIWDRRSGELLVALETGDVVSSIALSGDGRSFAVDESQTLRFRPTSLASVEASAEDLMARAARRSGLVLDGFELKPMWEKE